MVKQCVICGKEFNTVTVKQTCSSSCSTKLGSQNRGKQKIKPKTMIKVCKFCGDEFIPKTPRTIMCDKPHKKCEFCGKLFKFKRSFKKYCSDKHKAHCPICDREFLSRNTVITKLDDGTLLSETTCSASCKAKK